MAKSMSEFKKELTKQFKKSYPYLNDSKIKEMVEKFIKDNKEKIERSIRYEKNH